MVRDSDATLGRAMWHMLHTIAVNFPDGKGEGLTKQRLRGYYDFFKSLEHVLPRESWRDSWRLVTGMGNDELTWENFQQLRSHKKLSMWLFRIHDEIRKSLRQPMHGPSIPAQRYALFYKKYASYRTGSHGRNSNSNTNEAGTAQIKAMLAKSVSMMDTFMKQKYPDYATWPLARKSRTRLQDLDEASRWFWTKTQNTLSKNASWNAKNALKQRQDIVTKINNDHRRVRDRLRNLRAAPGIYIRNTFGL